MGFLRLPRLLAALLSVCLALTVSVPIALAVSAQDFPANRPQNLVIDSAEVLSRSSQSEIETRLENFGQGQLDARLVTLRRLDYNLSLAKLGEGLIEEWSSNSSDGDLPLLILLIEAQSNQTAIVADPVLTEKLSDSLLLSTGRRTMGQPLKDGVRYRQASLNALERLQVVLNGEVDPGPPIEPVNLAPKKNIPTKEETKNSNAITWVVVLLVVGTIVPMATWWVFSR
ncbi:MAG: YgcG family protein [Prochlorococcus sp.]|jgi:uncharacterized protein